MNENKEEKDEEKLVEDEEGENKDDEEEEEDEEDKEEEDEEYKDEEEGVPASREASSSEQSDIPIITSDQYNRYIQSLIKLLVGPEVLNSWLAKGDIFQN